MPLRFSATFVLGYASDLLVYVKLLPKNRLIAFDRKNLGELLSLNMMQQSAVAPERLGMFAIHHNVWFDSAAYYMDGDGQELFVASFERRYPTAPHLLVWKLPDGKPGTVGQLRPKRLQIAKPFQLIENRSDHSLCIYDPSSSDVHIIDFRWDDIYDDMEFETRPAVPQPKRARSELPQEISATELSWSELQDRGKSSALNFVDFNISTVPSDSSLPRPHTAEAVVQNTYCLSRSSSHHSKFEILVLGHDWGRVTLWNKEEGLAEKSDSCAPQVGDSISG